MSSGLSLDSNNALSLSVLNVVKSRIDLRINSLCLWLSKTWNLLIIHGKRWLRVKELQISLAKVAQRRSIFSREPYWQKLHLFWLFTCSVFSSISILSKTRRWTNIMNSLKSSTWNLSLIMRSWRKKIDLRKIIKRMMKRKKSSLMVKRSKKKTLSLKLRTAMSTLLQVLPSTLVQPTLVITGLTLVVTEKV